MTTYSYAGFCYAQRPAGSLITFVAPVGEIKVWAGVPRKHFNYQHGFQRALADKRVGELRDFYALDSQNITPTAIVVAVRAGACKVVKLSAIENGLERMPEGLCEISFDLNDLSQESTSSLIDSALKIIRERLGNVVTSQVDDDLNAAVQVAIEAETVDDATDGTGAISTSEADLADPPASHL